MSLLHWLKQWLWKRQPKCARCGETRHLGSFINEDGSTTLLCIRHYALALGITEMPPAIRERLFP